MTISELERILTEQFDQQTAALMEKIDSLSNELAEARDVATTALKLAEDHQDQIDTLKSENIALNNELSSIRTKDIRDIEERIEDRANRQMRKSVVLKNVPESKDVTWEAT